MRTMQPHFLGTALLSIVLAAAGWLVFTCPCALRGPSCEPNVHTVRAPHGSHASEMLHSTNGRLPAAPLPPTPAACMALRVPTMYGAHRGWSSSRPNASAPPYITGKALSDWMSEGYVQALPGLTGNLFRQMVGAEAVMAALSVLQRQQGVEGGLAEIGVHHGTFLISMALLGKQGEHILALDLFEQGQDKNIDRSGNGRSDIMRGNLKAVNFSGNNHLTVHTGASTELNCAQFCGLLGGQPLRLFHIDGGHTADIVLNDLAFADCALADGGIVMMDDFSNLYWSGVLQGLVTYMNTYRGSTRLAPLLLAFNKFYLTTVSHHQQYLANVTAWPVWFDACTNNLNMKDGRNHCIQAPGLPHPTVSPPAKFNFTGFPVAIADWPMTYSGPELYKWWRKSVGV
ncbi:hypothetical protein V8C86DRAFT_2561964 [Haematococcus lacustris]